MADTTDHDTVLDILNTDRNIAENCDSMEHGKQTTFAFRCAILPFLWSRAINKHPVRNFNLPHIWAPLQQFVCLPHKNYGG